MSEKNMIPKYKGQLTKVIEINDKKLEAYIPSSSLKEAVNLMMLLKKRPLLLMGEPGCGKTRLAEALAYELHGANYMDFYFEWHIKSTSKVQEGLYRYDALKRLNDAQINPTLDVKERKEINNLTLDKKNSYIQRGPLAKAFKASSLGKPAIILIDEIDKADIDFPNDLLLELDKFEFVITETGEKIPAPKEPPLIFITSNGEKELPAAFLRRCLFHYIKFPDEKQLKTILLSHFTTSDITYREKAIKDFITIRKQLKNHVSEADKKVSTSELIDWFSIINDLLELKNKKELDEIEQEFLQKLENWSKEKNLTFIPFYQILLKNVDAMYLFKDMIDEF